MKDPFRQGLCGMCTLNTLEENKTVYLTGNIIEIKKKVLFFQNIIINLSDIFLTLKSDKSFIKVLNIRSCVIV